MKHCWWIRTPTVILLALMSTAAEASSMFGDSSGNAMQRYDSHMMSSPMTHFRGMFTRSFWPYISYSQPPTFMIVKIQDQILELDLRPMPPPAASITPKFWTARCGVFVELEVSPKMNLMEEERRSCSP